MLVLVLLNWPVHIFCLRVNQVVDLATPKVSAVSLIGLVFQTNDALLHAHQHLYEPNIGITMDSVY